MPKHCSALITPHWPEVALSAVGSKRLFVLMKERDEFSTWMHSGKNKESNRTEHAFSFIFFMMFGIHPFRELAMGGTTCTWMKEM